MSDQTLATRQKNLAESLGIPVGLVGTTDDPEETMQRIMEEIATAATPEAVLKSGTVESMKDNVGRPLMLRAFRWQASDYGDVPFAVIEAVDTVTGEPKTIVSGARKVVIKLARIAQLDGFPVQGKFTSKEIELDDGTRGDVFDLVPLS